MSRGEEGTDRAEGRALCYPVHTQTSTSELVLLILPWGSEFLQRSGTNGWKLYLPCLPQVNLEMAVLLRWISVQTCWQESAKDTESHGKEFMCLTEQMLPWMCLLEAFPQELSSGSAWGVQTERASQGCLMCEECEKSLTNQPVGSAGKKYKIWERLVNTHTAWKVNSALVTGAIHESVEMTQQNGHLCCGKVDFCKSWCSWRQLQKSYSLQ